MKTHTIRIRGPWTYRLQGGEEGSMKIPGAWDGDETQVTFVRGFNWLAELEPTESVWLVFRGYGGAGPVSINGTCIGELTSGPAEFELTAILKPRNEMQLSMSFDSCPKDAPRGLWGDVALEVRTSQPEPEN